MADVAAMEAAAVAGTDVTLEPKAGVIGVAGVVEALGC